MPKTVAIEMMNFNPFLGPLADGNDPRPSENKRLKELCELYMSIGFYRDLDQEDNHQIRYYLFKNRHRQNHAIPTYSSLLELKDALATDPDRKDIFARNPRIYIEGHGGDDRYGIGGDHPSRDEYKSFLENPEIPNDASEQIHGIHFDKIISDLREVICPETGELIITLEVCNADNIYLGKKLWNNNKTFLARLSESHQDITFSGTGPWDSSHDDTAILTGTRAPGGMNTPVMSIGGNIWKNGNTLAFYNEFTMDNDESLYQVIVRKSKFSSTQTAKNLKTNTVCYAAEILEHTRLDLKKKKSILQKISGSREILRIADLELIPDLATSIDLNNDTTEQLTRHENHLLTTEKDNYLQLVHEILEKGNKADHRDILKIALGLKDFTENGCIVAESIFDGHEGLLHTILENKRLLELTMVACGKVLIAGPSNDSLINLLMFRGISVNSVDEHGMTAMHYALQNFYIYRKEPLDLVKKLLGCGADLDIADQEGYTPRDIAEIHGNKPMVLECHKLPDLINTCSSTPSRGNEVSCLLSRNLSLFRQFENEQLEKNRHHDPKLQHELDKRFGLVLSKQDDEHGWRGPGF